MYYVNICVMDGDQSRSGASRPARARTAKFREQHEDILRTAGEIERCLDPTTLARDANRVGTLIAELAGKVSVHLAMEDKGLYPSLERHPSARVRMTAATYQREMGGLAEVFGAYIARWRDRAKIRDHSEEFARETQQVFQALSARIARENDELYVLLEQMD